MFFVNVALYDTFGFFSIPYHIEELICDFYLRLLHLYFFFEFLNHNLGLGKFFFVIFNLAIYLRIKQFWNKTII